MKNEKTKDMKKKYPEIYRRYERQVIAHPDGAIVHTGDCGLYNVHLKICTCGLHHMLLPLEFKDIKQIYPKYFDEIRGKVLVEELLREKSDYGLWTLCAPCEGSGEIEVEESESSLAEFIENEAEIELYGPDGREPKKIEIIKCEHCKGKGFVPFTTSTISGKDSETMQEVREMFKSLEEKEENLSSFRKLSKDLNLGENND